MSPLLALLACQATTVHIRGVNPDLESLGASVAVVGDLEQRGVIDFAIGAPRRWFDSRASAWREGSIFFVDLARREVVGSLEGGRTMGGSLAWIGDIDRDGTPDFVAGGEGLLLACSGKTREVFWRRASSGREQLEHATLSDRDGDGVRELVLDDRSWTSGRPGPRPVFWSGATGLDIPTAELAGDLRAQCGIAEVGDLDGDGHTELVLLAERPDGAEACELSLVVLSGFDLAERDRFDIGLTGGDTRGMQLSRGDASLAPLGDIDCDGVLEVLIGRVLRDRETRSEEPCLGFVTAFDVRARRRVWERRTMTRTADFSCLVSPGSDVDGDGIPDALVRERVDRRQSVPGRLVLRSGRDGELIREHVGAVSFFCDFPQSAEFVRDIDGDGIEEYVVTEFCGLEASGAQEVARIHSGRTGAEVVRMP